MKTKHIISSITPLACAIGLNCLGINSARAANLSFAYTFESNETISGTFEGDLVPGTTEYENLSNLSATYSGTPDVIFDSIDAGSSFDTELSEFFSLVGRQSSEPENVFTIVGEPSNDIQVVIESAGILDFDRPIVASRFEVDVDGGVATTPEPNITLALMALGSLSCLQKLRKKRVSA